MSSKRQLNILAWKARYSEEDLHHTLYNGQPKIELDIALKALYEYELNCDRLEARVAPRHPSTVTIPYGQRMGDYARLYGVTVEQMQKWRPILEDSRGNMCPVIVKYIKDHFTVTLQFPEVSQKARLVITGDPIKDLDLTEEELESVTSKGPFCTTCGHENEGTCWRPNCPN